MVMQDMGLPVERVIPPDKPRDADKLQPEVRNAFDIRERPEDPLSGQLPGNVKPKDGEPAINRMPTPTSAPAAAE